MLGYILVRLVDLYSIIIVIYVVMSWIPMKSGSVVANLYDVFGKICDPYLNLFKKIMPPIGGVVDITPIFAIIALELVMRIIAFIL